MSKPWRAAAANDFIRLTTDEPWHCHSQPLCLGIPRGNWVPWGCWLTKICFQNPSSASYLEGQNSRVLIEEEYELYVGGFTSGEKVNSCPKANFKVSPRPRDFKRGLGPLIGKGDSVVRNILDYVQV